MDICQPERGSTSGDHHLKYSPNLNVKYYHIMAEVSTLIEEIKKHPELYDPNKIDFYNSEKKRVAWRDIAISLGSVTAEQCQKTWSNIRDRYVKEVREIETKRKNNVNSPEQLNSKWRLFDNMSFYREFIKSKNTSLNSEQYQQEELFENPGSSKSLNNEVHLESSSESETDQNPSTTFNTTFKKLYSKKRKQEDEDTEKAVLTYISKKQDEAGNFASSVASVLRRLSDKKMSIAKICIMNLLYKIEFENFIPEDVIQ